MKIKGLSDGARMIYAAVRQAVYAGAAMVASIAALTLHLQKEDHLARYCLYGAGAFGLLFLLNALFTKTRSK